MSPAIKLALKLELATAQRKGELVGAALPEFDFEEQVWTIPAERSKNGKAHRVPLSPLALELIQEARTLADDPEDDAEATDPKWLFPSPRGDEPIKPEAVNHALRKALTHTTRERPTPAIKLVNVTPHDLRRTTASGMASLGIARLTISKVLDHVETGVTAVYDRHGYDAEKRHALEAWAAHLEGILADKPKADNVIELATAGEVL